MTGNVWYVHYGTGSDGNKGTFDRPFKTLDYAIGRCTASQGDVIYLMAGHSEAIIAAAGVVADVAGVTIIGLGTGSAMAQILFTTAASTDIDVTAAGVRFINVRFTAGFADITGGFDIGASNVEFISCRFDESATDLNWVIVMDIITAVNGFVMIDCDYVAGDASNDTLLNFAGTNQGTKFIGNRCYHLVAQTAAAAFIASATQQEACVIEDNYFHTEVAVATSAAFITLAGTTNNGFAVNNAFSSVDADLTATEFRASIDLTGLCCYGNRVSSGVGDTYALLDTFMTVEDLT
jgi:hypothetical protein